MTDLKKEYDRTGTKKLFNEFPQTDARVISDTFMWQKIVDRGLRVDKGVGSTELRQHVLNAVAKDTGRGIRFDKDKTTAKIDAAVACAMASFGSSTKHKVKRGFVAV